MRLSAPYFAKAGAGWNISYPESGETVQPFESSTVTGLCDSS